MDENIDPRIIAMFDQINAHHRDGLKAFHEAVDALSKLPPEHQKAAMEDMPLSIQVVMYIEASETNTQWVIDLIPLEARLLVESWDTEEEDSDGQTPSPAE